MYGNRYYGYSSASSLADTLVAVAGILIVVGLVLCALYLIACFRIFKKADRPGGFVFIPVYGTYVLYDIAESKGLFWGTLFASILAAIFNAANTGHTPFLTVLIVVCTIIQLVLNIVLNVRLARVFGHGGGFACGLKISALRLPLLYRPRKRLELPLLPQ